MESLRDRFAGLQDQGDRDYQEDDFGVLDGRDLDLDGAEHTVLIVSDGMGGHVAGATASNIAVKAFIDSYQRQEQETVSERLRGALDVANENIAGAIVDNSALDGMGATVVAVVINKRGVEWVSVGDSPLWIFSNNQLHRLNADHSMVAIFDELVEVGQMSREDAAIDPKRHQLRAAVSGEALALIDLSSQPVAIAKSDILIVASDGIRSLSELEITELLKRSTDKPLTEQAQDLLLAVKDKHVADQDNITLLLYRSEHEYSKGTIPPSLSGDKKKGVADGTGRAFNVLKFIPWLFCIALLIVIFLLTLNKTPKALVSSGIDIEQSSKKGIPSGHKDLLESTLLKTAQPEAEAIQGDDKAGDIVVGVLATEVEAEMESRKEQEATTPSTSNQ